jgi:hypothetical protein
MLLSPHFFSGARSRLPTRQRVRGLARVCDVPYSTLKNTEQRSGQLTVDTIERICLGLEIPLSVFFTEKGA